MVAHAAIPDPTKEGVIKWAKRTLAPGVLHGKAIDVFLQQEDWDAAFTDAIIWYCAERGQVKPYDFTLVAGKAEYDMPADCNGVVEFVPPGALHEALYTGFGFEERGYPIGLGGMSAGPFLGEASQMIGPLSAVVQDLQYGEMAKRALGRDIHHEWHPEHKKLHVWPLETSGAARVFYISNEVDLTTIPVKEFKWIRDFVKATALLRLSVIYQKYESGLPGVGDVVNLSSRMQDDATQALEALQGLITNEDAATIVTR